MNSLLRPRWWCLAVLLMCSGCASWRTVSVRVEHERTGRPLPGVFVYTGYVTKPFSLAARREDQGYTDAQGRVLLRANFLRYEPTLFGISGEDFTPAFYLQETPGRHLGVYVSTEAEDRIFARRSKLPPAAPDITIKVSKPPQPGLAPIKWLSKTSFLEQLNYDLRDAWNFLTAPFRPKEVCGYEGK